MGKQCSKQCYLRVACERLPRIAPLNHHPVPPPIRETWMWCWRLDHHRSCDAWTVGGRGETCGGGRSGILQGKRQLRCAAGFRAVHRCGLCRCIVHGIERRSLGQTCRGSRVRTPPHRCTTRHGYLTPKAPADVFHFLFPLFLQNYLYLFSAWQNNRLSPETARPTQSDDEQGR